MRKVFLLFILLLPITVSGKEYTEYGEYQYSDKEVIASDLIEVIKENKYKFYYKKKVYDKIYHIEGENNKKYPYKSNKKKYSEYSTYSNIKPEVKKGRIIEEKLVTKYQSLKKVRYVKISNITHPKLYVHVGDINIYVDDVKINYEYTTNYEVIENPYDNFGFVKTSDGVLIFDLKDYYDPVRIKVEFIGKSSGYNESYTFDIEFGYDNSFEHEYIKDTRIIEFKNTDYFNGTFYIKSNIYEVSISDVKELLYDDKLLDEIDENKSDLYKQKQEIYYRYRDTYYKYYRIERIYLNGYYTSYKGYIKDKNKSKTSYKYRVRSYIEETKNKIETNIKSDKYRHQEVFIMLPVFIGIIFLLLKRRRKDAID